MKKFLYKISLPILCGVVLAGCSKSNVSPPTPLEEIAPTNVTVDVKWYTPTGNGDGGLDNYYLAPEYANGKIFVPNQNGKIWALDVETGETVWRKNVGMSISSRPNSVANAVIFGSMRGDLIVLDTDNGELLWGADLPSSLLSQPTVYGNGVYTYTHDGSVSAYDLTTGLQTWTQSNNIPDLMLPIDSSPIVLNNTVMVGSSFGSVLGFSADEGDRTINVPVAIPRGVSPAEKMVDIVANPIVYGNLVIFASYQGAIVALEKDTGRMAWAKKSSVISNIDINDNTIYTTQDDSQIKAFDVADGHTVWTQDILKWRDISNSVYYKGMIVVADYQGYLHFFNALNGNYLGRYKLTPESKIFENGIRGPILATEKGIAIEANNGDTYLVDAKSDSVIYSNILSDHEVNKGKTPEHIDVVEIPVANVATAASLAAISEANIKKMEDQSNADTSIENSTNAPTDTENTPAKLGDESAIDNTTNATATTKTAPVTTSTDVVESNNDTDATTTKITPVTTPTGVVKSSDDTNTAVATTAKLGDDSAIDNIADVTNTAVETTPAKASSKETNSTPAETTKLNEVVPIESKPIRTATIIVADF